MRFQNTTGIITGASRGLGRSLALAFAKEGARLGIGYYRSERGALQTLKEIEELGGKGELMKMDVSNFKEVDQVIQSLITDFKKIDFLINNAAIVSDNPLALMSESDWVSVIETNLNGVFNCSKAIIRKMIAQRKGNIVNISSVAGIAASPGQVNYSASKGGLIAMSKTMAAELAPYGIRVNVVVPGLLTVGMSQYLRKDVAESYRKRIPLGRFGNPDEIAKAVLFLVSEEASYITGQVLSADGGLSL